MLKGSSHDWSAQIVHKELCEIFFLEIVINLAKQKLDISDCQAKLDGDTNCHFFNRESVLVLWTGRLLALVCSCLTLFYHTLNGGEQEIFHVVLHEGLSLFLSSW